MTLGTTQRAFLDWRDQARDYLARNIPPQDAYWDSAQPNLFNQTRNRPEKAITVPRRFLPFAERIACHAEDEKWSLLYQALWRLTHGEPHLFDLSTDPLVHKLNHMAKAIGRDAHKAKAFVRFRLLKMDDDDYYIAWHKPDHLILPIVAPFFARRFSVMKWCVATPQESAIWNGAALTFASGMPAEAIDHDDDFERVWLAYYKATFNPARVKIKMMKSEMPVRYWHTMPETKLIPGMLADASNRVDKMIEATRREQCD